LIISATTIDISISNADGFQEALMVLCEYKIKTKGSSTTKTNAIGFDKYASPSDIPHNSAYRYECVFAVLTEKYVAASNADCNNGSKSAILSYKNVKGKTIYKNADTAAISFFSNNNSVNLYIIITVTPPAITAGSLPAIRYQSDGKIVRKNEMTQISKGGFPSVNDINH
jgi:hypothetical protein